MDIAVIDYSHLDSPDILTRLFYPRPEGPGSAGAGEDIMIPVEGRIAVGACLHGHDDSAPVILFFHGNGEIVADYDEMGPLYNRRGINFMPVDYRGYGRSGGSPSVTSMMRDAHAIFGFVTNRLREKGFTGPLVVMGRSLGSAPALELASTARRTASIPALWPSMRARPLAVAQRPFPSMITATCLGTAAESISFSIGWLFSFSLAERFNVMAALSKPQNSTVRDHRQYQKPKIRRRTGGRRLTLFRERSPPLLKPG